MRWYRATLYERAVVGTDATRNPVTELRATGQQVLVRTAPAAPAPAGTDGNRFDAVRRTFVTRASAAALDGAAAIEVRGRLYAIDSVTSEASPTVISASRTEKG